MVFPFSRSCQTKCNGLLVGWEIEWLGSWLGCPLTRKNPFIVRSDQTSISVRVLPETEFLAVLGTTGVPSFIAGWEGVRSRKSLPSGETELRLAEEDS